MILRVLGFVSVAVAASSGSADAAVFTTPWFGFADLIRFEAYDDNYDGWITTDEVLSFFGTVDNRDSTNSPTYMVSELLWNLAYDLDGMLFDDATEGVSYKGRSEFLTCPGTAGPVTVELEHYAIYSGTTASFRYDNVRYRDYMEAQFFPDYCDSLGASAERHYSYYLEPIDIVMTGDLYSVPPAAVPLPGTLPLAAGGVAALGLLRRRRRAR